MRLKRAVTVAGYLLLGMPMVLAIPLAAQTENPPRPGRPLDAAKQILDLTEQQVLQLADLRKAHTEKVQGLTREIREAQKQKAESTDPNQIGSLELQIRSLQQQVREANQAYHQSALGILTETQKQKVAQIEEALKLAPQAGPLASLGLLQGPGRPGGPGPGFGRRGMGGFMMMAPGPMGPMPGMQGPPPIHHPMQGVRPAAPQNSTRL